MSRMPPIEEVISTSKLVVLPGFGVAVAGLIVIALISSLIARKVPFDWRMITGRLTPLLLLAALAAVNHFRDQPLPWWPDGKWWHEAIWLVLAAAVIELVSFTRISPWLIGLAGGLAASVVVSPNLRAENAWAIPLAGAAMAITSLIASRAKPTSSNLTPLGLAIIAGATSMVLLHAKSLGFADLALAGSVAITGLVLVGWFVKIPIHAAGMTLPLTAFLIMNRQLVDSDVPRWLMILTGSLPVCLLPVIFRPGRRSEWLSLALIVALSITVVGLAATLAPMTFDEEKW